MLSEGPIGLGEVAGCGTRCDTRQANTDIVREFGVVVIDAARQHEASAERSFPLKLDAFALRSRGILHRVADQYRIRSEEHTSELQSLMRISYAVFCLKKNIHIIRPPTYTHVNLITNNKPNRLTN